jgi:hypothetical protein
MGLALYPSRVRSNEVLGAITTLNPHIDGLWIAAKRPFDIG